MQIRFRQAGWLAALYAGLVGLLALAAYLGSRGSTARADGEGFTMLPTADVARALGAADLRAYDANGEKTLAEGHLPGAVHLTEYRTFEASVLPADKDVRLVFYFKNKG
jgi:hypothetical protein